MKLDWTIKVGDILTSLTILVSVVALLISWTKDRDIRETQQANLVRSAAAAAITNLDRWQALQLSLYQELQPEFVITSEKLAKNFTIIEVRDYLWKTINNKRIEISSKILEEKITTSYVDLIAHFPATRNQFLSMFKALNEAEESVSGSFLIASQKDIMDFEGKLKNYTSAMLGNALRSTAEAHKGQLAKEITEATGPVKEFLFEIIAKTNKEILHASNL